MNDLVVVVPTSFAPTSFALGKPNEGIHTHVLGVAVADVAMTAGAAYVIHRITDKPVLSVFVTLIGIGVFAHWYFGVDTTLNRALGLAESKARRYDSDERSSPTGRPQVL